MYENIAWSNLIYQLITFLFLIGIILLIVSFFRNSSENKKRLKRIEEKMDYLLEKNHKG